MKIIDDYSEYLTVVSDYSLFGSIPKEKLLEVISNLDITVKSFAKDEIMQQLDQPIKYSGLVLNGTVEGSFISETYDKINMNHFAVGNSFAEAFVCANVQRSPIQLRALTECVVMFIDLNCILTEMCDCSFKSIIKINLIKILANQNVFSNLKFRIASQRCLRDRIFIYLHSLSPDENGYLYVPFTQTALAEFLGVNRSALSRELGRMQNENIIKIDSKKVKLLV